MGRAIRQQVSTDGRGDFSGFALGSINVEELRPVLIMMEADTFANVKEEAGHAA
jgi:hypothetical protein